MIILIDGASHTGKTVYAQKLLEKHFEDIVAKAGVIEQRLGDFGLNREELIAENEYNLTQCITYNLPYILIDGEYSL